MKQVIRKTPLYRPLRNGLNRIRQEKDVLEWKRKGKTSAPPHIIKQRTLTAYAKRFGLKILVETGTYYGEMLEAMKNRFDHLYSIELSSELYAKAAERFRGIEHIELIQGDSGIELGNVMKKISQPALFWLDGHYSAGITAKGAKDTPIYEELNHILTAPDKGHVIIIDDARCFGKDPAYPSIKELSDFIKSKRPCTSIEVQDDSIRIAPIR